MSSDGKGQRRGRTGERGTTLLEIIVTVAIVTVGMLGYFTMHIRSFQVSGSSSAMSQAASLASAMQDQLLAVPYDNYAELNAALTLDACTTPTDVPPVEDLCKKKTTPINAKGVADTKGVFWRSYQVEKDPQSLDDDQPALLITVRVRYPAEDGRCPTCTTVALRQGWKAVTTRVRRTVAAY